MKNINLGGWQFSADPIPAFRAGMSFGRNSNASEFVGVNGVTPDDAGILPEDAFKVVRTKEGVIVVTAGEDKTPRCLLFVNAGGCVDFLAEATTGRILKSCSASSGAGSAIALVALLDVGQAVAFYVTDRRTDEVVTHTWNGSVVETKSWDKQAWDRRNDPPRSEENISWIPGNFRVVQLHGNDVTESVTLEKGEISRQLFGYAVGILAHGFGIPAEGSHNLAVARFGRDMHEELVIAPAKGEVVEQDRVAVLVHEYSPGSGAKRWPSFHIDWEKSQEVEKLASLNRGKGSGGDTYTLILAPTDWAQNVAGQFINGRDVDGQIISYKPGHAGLAGSEFPQDLVIAFSGDESRIRQFVVKVAGLPAGRLDGHILRNCGRGRVESHLKEVSGDSDFFLGADPNAVVKYVVQTHLDGDGELDKGTTQKAGGVGFSSFGDAFAGLDLKL